MKRLEDFIFVLQKLPFTKIMFRQILRFWISAEKCSDTLLFKFCFSKEVLFGIHAGSTSGSYL